MQTVEIIIAIAGPVFLVATLVIIPLIRYRRRRRVTTVLVEHGFQFHSAGDFGKNLDDEPLGPEYFLLGPKGRAQSYNAAVIERGNRLISISDDVFSIRSGGWLSVIRIELETSWTIWESPRHDHVLGIAEDSLTDYTAKEHARELGSIFLRRRADERAEEDARERRDDVLDDWRWGDYRPESIALQEFESGRPGFDRFFAIRLAGHRVRCALRAGDPESIVAPLAKWEDLIYDLSIADTVVLEIDPKHMGGWNRFAESVMPLVDDLVTVAQRIEQTVLDFHLGPEHFRTQKRFVAISMIASCRKCHAPYPINGPVKFFTCQSCGKTTKLNEEKHWSYVLRIPYLRYEDGGDVITDQRTGLDLERCEWKAEVPTCRACGAAIPGSILDAHPAGETTRFECPSCHAENVAEPPAEWVARVVDAAVLIYRTADGDAESVAASEPVFLSCSGCGRGVRVDSSSDRSVQCERCGEMTSVPQEVWNALHPAPTAAPWYVRYDHRVPADLSPEIAQALE